MASRMFDFAGRGGLLSGRLEFPKPPHAAGPSSRIASLAGRTALPPPGSRAPCRVRASACFDFDFAGTGSSAGVLGDGGFAADIEDLVAAADAMARAGMPPTLLVGHSLGGAAALAAATTLPGIRAVGTIAAPADVTHILTRLDLAGLERVMKAEVRGSPDLRPAVRRQAQLHRGNRQAQY